ncbi:MAG: aminotransferase class I/II-fold pyridoxal phosphate-dependent enzyme [Eubacteriales bacterium]|nr:aminotransferase class I/II-fold pyridoxal phosphate-dependent enzyme [Eubacteriales bacterium]
MSDRIWLASPHMGGGEMKYVQKAFDTNWVAPLGANVNDFEEDLRTFTGAPAAVALSAGTAALHLAAILAGVGSGDMVFCQDLTFSASVNPVMYLQARPVFLDSERDSWNLDPHLIRKAIEKYGVPKALVVVHLYGAPAKLDEICDICREYGIVLIEDAAEAMGAEWDGKKCGTFGQYGALSFNGNKIITTSGGGALLCRNKEDASHALKLATQAREPVAWYEHKEVGYNYRLSNICAGIGRGQMEVLPQRLEQKAAIYRHYRNELSGLPLTFQLCPNRGRSNHWLTAILLDRDCGVMPAQVIRALEEANIEARHIWKPMHLQPVFADAPFVSAEEDSVSEDIFSRGICLPGDTKMTAADMYRVTDCVKGLWK